MEYIMQARIADKTDVVYDVIKRDGYGNNITILTYDSITTAHDIMEALNVAMTAEYPGPARQINTHVTNTGRWCKWSGVMVSNTYAPGSCPDECRESYIR